MVAPQLTVVDTNDVPVTTWDNGVVQANTSSNILEIIIWNNRGVDTAVADLKEASITALDMDGRSITELVQGKWVHVNVPELDGNRTTWTRVGGTTAKMLRADGLGVSSGYVIKGTANDGNKETEASKVNYCTVRLKTVVPAGTSAGIRDYRIRINGYWT